MWDWGSLTSGEDWNECGTIKPALPPTEGAGESDTDTIVLPLALIPAMNFYKHEQK